MTVSMRAKQRGFWNFVIPAVAAVASSVLSKKSGDKASEVNQQTDDANVQAQRDINAENVAAQKEMNEANIAAQREFAQHGIQWKVADSRAAGLHPLFGAGLTGSTFSPSFQAAPQVAPVRRAQRQGDDYSWLLQLGQMLGNWLGQEQQNKVVQSQLQRSQADGESLTIVEHPGGGRTITYPIRGLESQVSGRPIDAPMFNEALGEGWISPRQLPDPYKVSHIANVTGDPFWQRFSFGKGFNVILPKTSEPQEVFEDKPLWFWAMVAKANVKEYGLGWLTAARAQFPSLREVFDGVVQELKAAGLYPFK